MNPEPELEIAKSKKALKLLKSIEEILESGNDVIIQKSKGKWKILATKKTIKYEF